jgi:hypothetical protein
MAKFEVELSEDGKCDFFVDGWCWSSNDPEDCIDEIKRWLETHKML